ncbi:MAG: MBL fold metallo-hydrolase, partial [Gemmatimonadetes bacterium]|nr:MBL fold metallo-hydrolase [Gemmatimonadota bacterium]
MAIGSVTVGSVEIVPLSDGTGRFPAANVFPTVSTAEWARHPEALSPDGELTTNFGCFLLRSGGKTVLVDTGAGPERAGRLPRELDRLGVRPEDVSVVVITHLHPDHVGWNLRRDGGRARLTFPKAQYRISRYDWEHFRRPDIIENAVHVRDQVLPLRDLAALDLVEGETAVTSELTMVPTPGHTPGHMSVAIHSQGERAFILGDVVNFPFQVEETAWEIVFDTDPQLARR